jgi:hypothetical protein
MKHAFASGYCTSKSSAIAGMIAAIRSIKATGYAGGRLLSDAASCWSTGSAGGFHSFASKI